VAINHFKGVIKELGPHTRQADATGSVSRYTYIEFTDGQMLRNVGVVGGLDGKLDAALSDPGEIELHMLGSAQKGGLLPRCGREGSFTLTTWLDSKVRRSRRSWASRCLSWDSCCSCRPTLKPRHSD